MVHHTVEEIINAQVHGVIHWYLIEKLCLHQLAWDAYHGALIIFADPYVHEDCFRNVFCMSPSMQAKMCLFALQNHTEISTVWKQTGLKQGDKAYVDPSSSVIGPH